MPNPRVVPADFREKKRVAPKDYSAFDTPEAALVKSRVEKIRKYGSVVANTALQALTQAMEAELLANGGYLSHHSLRCARAELNAIIRTLAAPDVD